MLVTRRQAAEILGYTHRSLATLMSRHPDVWPDPVGETRVAGQRTHLYDLDALKAAAGVYTGAKLPHRASLSDPDGLITCLYCDRRFRALSTHLRRAHGVTAAEYRAEHHLPATGSMVADVTRHAAQERKLRELADDPTALDHLKPYHSAEWMAGMTARNREAVRASHGIPLATEHRAPGRAHAVRQMVAARLAKLDASARDHGYTDAADAVARTKHLSAKAAARATGLSPQTIRRRRDEASE